MVKDLRQHQPPLAKGGYLRRLMEKALEMRCQGYFSQVKSVLLTRTLTDIDARMKHYRDVFDEMSADQKVTLSQKAELEQQHHELMLARTDLEKQVETRFRELRGAVSQLEMERDRIRDYLRIAEAVIVELDGDGNIQVLNRQGCEILGYAFDEICGRNWFDVMVPEHKRKQVRDDFSRLIGGDEAPAYYDNELITKAGEELRFTWHNTVKRDGDGKIVGTLSSGRDVTDIRATEVALRASEDRYRSFTETAADWFWEMDSDGRFTYVEGRYEEETGIPVTAVIGKTRSEIYGADPDDDVWIQHKATLEAHKPYKDFEYCSVVGDTEVFVRTSGTPVFDGNGAFIGYRGTARNVTEKVQAEQKLIQAEKSLRESEARFRLTVEKSPFPMVLTDGQGNVEHFNEKFVELFGWTTDDVRTPEEWWAAAYPDPKYRRVVKESWEEAVVGALEKGQEIEPQQWCLTCKDGRVREAEFRMVPLSPDLNAIAMNDLTERLSAERNLRQSEERFAAAFRVSPALLAITDAESEEFLDVNKAWLDTFGYTRDDIIGKRSKEFGTWKHPEVRDEMYRSAREDGRVRGVASTFTTNSGDEISLLMSGERMDVSGESQILWASIDITEQVNAETGLRKSEEALRRTLDNMVDGVVMISEKGIIKSFNRAAESIFGFSAHEAIGENVNILMRAEDAKHHDAHIRSYMKTGQAKIIGIGPREVVGRRKDGSTFPMELTVSDFQTDGECHFIGAIRDITKRKGVERQLHQAQKMEAVGQLTGGVAHDFNNLLSAVLLNLEYLETRLPDDAETRKSLMTAQRAAGRGAELTQHLLAFSRQQILTPAPTDVRNLIRQLIEILSRLLGDHIEIQVSLDDDTPMALVDAVQLESALLNLAINARDAMPAGGILLIETSHARFSGNALWPKDLKEGEYVVISVSDNGIGMPQEVLEKVFDPFFTTKEVGQGSGLGLSMVYGFLRQSGGHIHIHSRPKEGATVQLLLPCAVEEQGEALETESIESEFSGEGKVILVVEDSHDVRATVTEVLKQFGFDVIEAEHGPSARRILAEAAKIDLLMTDLLLPKGENGYEIAEAFEQAFPDGKVLITSGNPKYTTQKDTPPLTDRPFLKKPYDRGSLIRMLAQVVGR